MDRITHCPTCGEALVNTRSGASCPDGHGKIYPRLRKRGRTAEEREAIAKARAAVVAALPQARRTRLRDEGAGRLYLLDDLPGLWSHISRDGASLEQPVDGMTLALVSVNGLYTDEAVWGFELATEAMKIARIACGVLDISSLCESS